MARPAAAQPPCAKMDPVPLIVMSPTTIAKQDVPLLDLLTAPLKVTLACGRYTRPVISHVGLFPAADISTPEVKLGSWYSATPDHGPEEGACKASVPPPVGACV